MNSGTMSYVLLFAVVIIMLWFTMRSQSKRQKQHQQLVDSLKRGDEVVTIGRLHGVIDSINTEDKTVTLDCDGVYLVFDSVAIARVVNRAKDAAPVASAEASNEEKADKDAE